MKSLPVETWMQVIQKSLDKRDWFNLSITSSIFRPLAQASLFYTVRLYRHISYEDDDPVNRTLALFTRSLVERPELASYVHILHIASISDHEELDRYSRHPLIFKLASLSRLRRIHISGFTIDIDFCSALGSHPHLSFVSLNRCAMHARLIRAPLRTVVRNHFINLNITDPSGPAGPWAAVAPAGLESLSIDSAKDLHMDAIISDLTLQGGTSVLTTLSIFAPSLPAKIIPLLVSSPKIRRLSISYWNLSPNDTARLRSLPVDALPLLEEFTGLADIAKVFVSGRPVHTVTLDFLPKSAIDIPLSLQNSTVSVFDLKIMNLYAADIGPVLQNVPTSVRRFAWHEGDKAKIMSCIPALSRLKDLRAVAGYVSTPISQEKHREQAEIVQEFSDACPSIREFDFQEERWLAREEGGWERYFAT